MDKLESLGAKDGQGDSSPVPKIVFVCHRGNDSQIAVQHVLKTLDPSRRRQILDIIGGLTAWSKKVDKEFPVY